MTVLGFFIAVFLFCHYQRRLRHYRTRYEVEQASDGSPAGSTTKSANQNCGWQEGWDRWQEKHDKMHRKWERRAARRMTRDARRNGKQPETGDEKVEPPSKEEEMVRRARKRARAEVGFYSHLMSYLGVIAFLALINLMTTRYPWFLWPALGWGIGLFSHYMAVFGSRMLRERYFDPAVEREVRREKVGDADREAGQHRRAVVDHRARDPQPDRRRQEPGAADGRGSARRSRTSSTPRWRSRSSTASSAASRTCCATPRRRTTRFDHVNLAAVVDSALTQLRAKLDAAKVSVARNYIGGPTVLADAEKLRQVFANVLDNAIDALEPVAEGRRIDLFIENGGRSATVRVRDNGCGIPPDKIDRIFNPFFTTKEKGTGLGMAISKKIVEAHEGTIDVVSEPGRGTEFAVTLPLPQ